MCGRLVYVWDAKTGKLVARLVDRPIAGQTRNVLEKRRYNVPPSSHLPVLAAADGQGTVVQVARWGFPLPQNATGVFNTRVETAPTSPMWAGLLGSSRCLFVAKGFYEWSQHGKRPHFIQRADGEPMLLAGLLATRRVAGADALCASILTCAPNEVLAPLHDRMPVVIEQKQAPDWVHARGGVDAVLQLARPAAPGVLEAYPVGPAVNSTKNDDPGLLAPMDWF